MVQKIIDNLANGHGCRVTLKPFPLQHSKYDANQATKNRFAHGKTKAHLDQDLVKIRQVWESMGFVQLCDSQIWGRNECFRHPDPSKFCTKLFQ